MTTGTWLAMAGLGAFHGINPAMGWLFAVALGLHRRSRSAVLAALIPIAIGHALAISAVGAATVVLGVIVDVQAIRIAAGAVLIGWALHHVVRSTRHRVRVGMQVGMLGLGVWSFLMATAHGAGLMLVPFLLPHDPGTSSAGVAGGYHHAIAGSLAAIGVHVLAVLVVTGRWSRCSSTSGSGSRSCAGAGSTSTGCGAGRSP